MKHSEMRNILKLKVFGTFIKKKLNIDNAVKRWLHFRKSNFILKKNVLMCVLFLFETLK